MRHKNSPALIHGVAALHMCLEEGKKADGTQKHEKDQRHSQYFCTRERLVIDGDVVNDRQPIVPAADVTEQKVKTRVIQHRICEGLLFCSLSRHP